MSRMMIDLSKNETIRFIIIPSKWENKYYPTDMYIVKDNKLYNLVEETASEDLYVLLSKEELLVYQEELDGSTIDKEEAKDKFPEEFV